MATPQNQKTHVVVIPYPGRGHINPMLDICRAVAQKSCDNIIMTVIVTEEWLGLIGGSIKDKPTNISFATIPNVLPSERVRGDDTHGFWAAVWKNMEEPTDRLMDQLQPQPALVLADAVLPWAADVASRRNIPLASVWPMSASVFTVLYHFDLLVANGHFPINMPVNGAAIVDYIPGLPPSRVADVSKGIRKQDVNFVLQLIPKAKFLIFTTIYELESSVINALKQNSPYSIHNVGPYALYSKLIEHNKYDQHDNNEYYLKWLDAQPPNSVLYISLGSFLSVSTTQMDEMAAGIRASGVRYLWVARGETCRLQGVIHEGGNQGLVVEWCNQLHVLSHPSVGGFLSHCGWNSTKEALMTGMPLLTFPIILDQVHNAKAIVEDWKVGWRLKREFIEQELAGREEIAEIVKSFMNLENDERKELSRNATELQKIFEGEFAQGQSFECNVEGFVKSILQLGSR